MVIRSYELTPAARLTLTAIGVAALLLLIAVGGGGAVGGCCSSALIGVRCLLMQTESIWVSSEGNGHSDESCLKMEQTGATESLIG